MSIITISHETFGAGRAVAERVTALLNYRCISREVLIKASERYGIAEASPSPKGCTIPVATTFMARGIIPFSHELSLGTLTQCQ